MYKFSKLKSLVFVVFYIYKKRRRLLTGDVLEICNDNFSHKFYLQNISITNYNNSRTIFLPIYKISLMSWIMLFYVSKESSLIIGQSGESVVSIIIKCSNQNDQTISWLAKLVSYSEGKGRQIWMCLLDFRRCLDWI